jgi:hypothetical protein
MMDHRSNSRWLIAAITITVFSSLLIFGMPAKGAELASRYDNDNDLHNN